MLINYYIYGNKNPPPAMSKIFRQNETKEIENFLSSNEIISSKLKSKIQEEMKSKEQTYHDSFIWLITTREKVTIDVFNVKGEVFETKTFHFKDYPVMLF